MCGAIEHGNGFPPVKTAAKAPHVNMMTDTIIANMPPEGLRVVMRGILGGDPNLTKRLNELAIQYFLESRPVMHERMFSVSPIGHLPAPDFYQIQSKYRCLMGSGYGFKSVEILTDVLHQVEHAVGDEVREEGKDFFDVLATIDGDIVQAMTAIQKELLGIYGLRQMLDCEKQAFAGLKAAIYACQHKTEANGEQFAFDRGLASLLSIEGVSEVSSQGPSPRSSIEALSELSSLGSSPRSGRFGQSRRANSSIETFKLGSDVVPRMFMGLWQLSSPSWGSASKSQINKDFRKHINAGFTAYDMADHYGDAEITFGSFRSSQPDADQIYCATKWAVFQPIEVTEEVVKANITERLLNVNSEEIELLQFHWQDYDDPQFIKAARLITEDPRVRNLGLCNFDTQHMEKLLMSGTQIVSNQVQFSLIDLRPTYKMAHTCRQYNVKLLTYGSLCGGFLADKWLGMPTPGLFDKYMTPSHRKYLEMIMVWGGWALFQNLLAVLDTIGQKYNASISNVAIRWVLDHDYVGAVIVGARMGISEHTEENLKAFSFKLDDNDKASIQDILDRSKARDVFEDMGDCGAEYR